MSVFLLLIQKALPKTILLLFILMAGLVSSSIYISSEESFSDIPEGAWYEDYVMTLVGRETQVINGFEDGTFRPHQPVTVAQFLTMMVRSYGYELEAGTDYWAQPFIDKAIALGLIEANDFENYTTGVTREQMASILICDKVEELDSGNNYAFDGKIDDLFTDGGDIAARHTDDVIRSYELGIINGYEDGAFRGERIVTRAEAATILVKGFYLKNRSLHASGEASPKEKYEAFIQPLYSVRDFGAKGDGVTDDTEAFKKALASGDIIIPAGTFRVTNLNIPSNRRIIGTDRSTSIVHIHEETAKNYNAVFNIIDKSNVTLKNFTIDMTPDDGEFHTNVWDGLRCAYIRYSTDIHIEDVTMSNNEHGAVYTGQNSYVYFDGCDFINVDTAINSDRDPYGDKYIYIENCYFEGHTFSEPAYFDNASHIYIRNCVAKNKEHGSAFRFEDCTDVLIENSIMENMGNGVYLERCSNVDILNNQISECRWSEIYINNSSDILVSGNTISRVISDAPGSIWINHSKDLEILNNSISSHQNHVMVITGTSSNFLVEGNVFIPKVAGLSLVVLENVNLYGTNEFKSNEFIAVDKETTDVAFIDNAKNINNIQFSDNIYHTRQWLSK